MNILTNIFNIIFDVFKFIFQHDEGNPLYVVAAFFVVGYIVFGLLLRLLGWYKE